MGVKMKVNAYAPPYTVSDRAMRMMENIVWAHQAEYYAAIQESGKRNDCGPFIDFMLDKILRTLKAKGEAYESDLKSREKSWEKKTAIAFEMPPLDMI